MTHFSHDGPWWAVTFKKTFASDDSESPVELEVDGSTMEATDVGFDHGDPVVRFGMLDIYPSGGEEYDPVGPTQPPNPYIRTAEEEGNVVLLLEADTIVLPDSNMGFVEQRPDVRPDPEAVDAWEDADVEEEAKEATRDFLETFAPIMIAEKECPNAALASFGEVERTARKKIGDERYEECRRKIYEKHDLDPPREA